MRRRQAAEAWLLRHGDSLLVGTFTLAAEVEVLLRVPGPSWRQASTAAANLSLLVLRWRRRPLLALAVLVAAVAVLAAVGGVVDLAVPICAVFVVSYSFGVHGTWREIAAGTALVPLAVLAANQHQQPPGHPLANSLLFFTVFGFGAPLLIGRLVRSRFELVGRLREQTRLLHAERDRRAAVAVASDRIELTRALHRTVSRCVEALLAQVAVAEADRGRNGLKAASAIESIARKALGDMRRLLALLARDGATDGHHGHTPVSLAGTEPEQPRTGALEITPAAVWWPLLAIAFFGALVVSIDRAPGRRGSYLLNIVAVAAVAAPLIWAGRRPLAAATASLIAATLASLLLTRLGPLLPSILLLFALPFAVAAHGGWKRALLGLAVCAAGLAAFYSVSRPPLFGVSEAMSAMLVALGAWGAGRVVWDRSQLAGELVETNRKLAAERDRGARDAVIAERARVAREVHDVIGHCLTVIVLQAGAARRAWHADRDQALEALSTVSRVARATLAELVAGLDALDPASPAAAKMAYLRDLEPLVDRARRAGLGVDLHIEGSPTPVSTEVEVAAYRVLQEALTNVVKHSPGARTEILVRYAAGQLELAVVNSCPTTTIVNRSMSRSSGQGLAGMCDRVTSCGGYVDCGRREGTFAVHAQLPMLGSPK